MPDKSIGELTAATQVNDADLFVLEQGGAAKKLTGKTLEAWLLSMADGHGGISSISKTSTSGLSDTYTIVYADESTTDFTVMNGNGIADITFEIAYGSNYSTTTITFILDNGGRKSVEVRGGTKGADGRSAYVHIKFSSEQPTSDEEMHDYADDWMGFYSGTSSTAPTSYTSYTWVKVRGEQGGTGAQGKTGEKGDSGCYAWRATAAPIEASGLHIFAANEIVIPSAVSATPRIGDMIWWQNKYYFISSIAYQGNNVNSYACNNEYGIYPGSYLDMVYYADYGIDYSSRLQEQWEAGKALFCVMPQEQQDDPQNVLALTNVTENYQGGSGDTPHTRFIFSAVHHTSNGNVLEVAISGDSAINSWSTATYSLSGGGDSDQVFIAEYGVTTASEIETAYQAGKAIFAVDPQGNCNFYQLVARYSATSFDFGATAGGYLFNASVSNSTWSESIITLAQPQTSGTPAALGTAARGTATAYARADHVHAMPSASDVGAVAVAQGVAHAGDFLVVGSDGNVTTKTMTAWQGGNY